MSTPIVQEFDANFTKFAAAVDDAQVQLKAFATNTTTVSNQLSRMTDQFSGAKVIQQATLMAEAIDRVGGASALTTAELAKIAPTINDAVDKMSKMGVDVPNNLQAIADKTKNISTETDSLSGVVDGLITRYLGFEAIRQAFDWVSDIAASAQALENLSNQTHVNVEDLQILQQAFADSGVDAGQLARALFEVSQKAASGDDSVTRALAMMGLSLEDIKGLQGEDLFLAIEHGLSTLQGSLRDTAAADIFGTKLGGVMAGASTNIDDTLKHFRDMNDVIGTDNVRALADYNKAIDETKTHLTNLVANGIGPAAQGFNMLYTIAQKQGFWTTIGASVKDFAVSLMLPGAPAKNLIALVDDMHQKDIDLAASTSAAAAASKQHTVALNDEQVAAQFVALMTKNTTQALTDWQKADLDALDKTGQANEKNAAVLKVSADQFNAWKTANDAAKESAKQFAAAVDDVNASGTGWQGTLAEMDPAVVDYGKHLLEAGVSASTVATYFGLTASQVAAMSKSIADDNAQLKLQADQVKTAMTLWDDYFALRAQHGATATDQQIADIHKWEQAQIQAAQKAKTDTVAFYAALAAEVNEKLQWISVDWTSINNTMTTDTKAGLQQIADKAKATLDVALTHVGDFSAAAIQKYRDTADAAQKAADDWGTAYADNADKATAAINQTGQAMDALTAKTKKAADDAAAQAAQDQQTGWNASLAGVSDSDALTAAAMVPGSMLGFSTGQQVLSGGDNASATYDWIQRLVARATARAGGGAVSAGSPYVVGESGPELFVPGQSGTIVPNGGGATINNTFHLVDTASNLAKQVSDLIARQVTQARRV